MNLKEYQKAANLIRNVLLEKLTVAQALGEFPSSEDINIKCAFDALVHREADEDLRNKIPDYSFVQDEYLETISNILYKGKPLPKNVIESYIKYHKDNILPKNTKGFKNVINYLKRTINF